MKRKKNWRQHAIDKMTIFACDRMLALARALAAAAHFIHLDYHFVPHIRFNWINVFCRWMSHHLRFESTERTKCQSVTHTHTQTSVVVDAFRLLRLPINRIAFMQRHFYWFHFPLDLSHHQTTSIVSFFLNSSQKINENFQRDFSIVCYENTKWK